MKATRQYGFSLVELSIVLVILGLLTGGILAGQSLIRAAELRAISTEYSKYQTALQTFRDKYFAIPGDFNKATSFWTSLGGTGADGTCFGTAPAGQATCNGDGDGTLMDYANQYSTNSSEAMRFWQHLSNAGLIEGSYTGEYVMTAPTVGTHVPASKIGNASYWQARNGFAYNVRNGTTLLSSTPIDIAGDYGRNMMTLTRWARSESTAGSWVIKPEEAWNIDTKMDDGKPGTGKVFGSKGNGTNTRCASNAGSVGGDAAADYALSTNSKDCHLVFPNAF